MHKHYVPFAAFSLGVHNYMGKGWLMNLPRSKLLGTTATTLAGGVAARLNLNNVCTESKADKLTADPSRNLCEGTVMTKERTFTFDDVRSFCQLCRNTNPIHLEPASAKGFGFSGCVVPELLYAGLFPAIIGTHSPGSIYVSQRLDFKRPVLVGHHLLAEVKAVHLRHVRDKYRVEFATSCWIKEENVLAIEGSAVALLGSLYVNISADYSWSLVN